MILSENFLEFPVYFIHLNALYGKLRVESIILVFHEELHLIFQKPNFAGQFIYSTLPEKLLN